MPKQIVTPLASLLGLTQDVHVIGLELIQLVLSSVQMQLNHPVEAPCPLPIPVVIDWIYYLFALGVYRTGSLECLPLLNPADIRGTGVMNL
jgi:hypothetical protein